MTPAPDFIATSRRRIVMLVNVSWFFVSHRLPVASCAIEHGYEYHVATRIVPESDAATLHAAGIVTHRMPFARGGASPVADLRSAWAIVTLFRRLRPHLVHLVTLKVIILGGLVARMMRVPAVVAAVPGLGYAFVARGLWASVRRSLVGSLLRLALGHGRCAVVVQNPDDREYLVRAGVLRPQQAILIRGAGVDMAQFAPVPEPGGRVRVLLASRMLREKGVGMFVEAARELRARGVEADFLLAGNPDSDNPGSYSSQELEAFHAAGHVQWLGHVQDMSTLLRSVNVVCLPTHYGEGVPKVLIEAAATGRAIVTTDVPGCREIVLDGRSGVLVPPRDLAQLVSALARVIGDPALRARMGGVARAHAIEHFSTAQVVAGTLQIYDRLLSDAGYA